MISDRRQMITFGEWLDFQMRTYDYTSDLSLAHELGINSSTIGRWKKGGATPDVAQLRRLARLFRTPMPQLLVLAGHVSSEEMEGVQAPELPKFEDPTPAMIERSNISSEVKDVLRAWKSARVEKDATQARALIEVLEGRKDLRAAELEYDRTTFHLLHALTQVEELAVEIGLTKSELIDVMLSRIDDEE